MQTDNYFVLMDPAWDRDPAVETPPFEAVLGVWPVLDDGSLGRYRANPDYEPAAGDAPADPIDATLRTVEDDDAVLDRLQVLLRDCLVDVAVDARGVPVLGDSPDDVPCVLVVTGGPNRRYAPEVDWRTADLEGLVAVLDDGVDVLLNPGAPGMTRLDGDFVREALGLDGEEAAALLARAGAPRHELTVVPWTL